MKQKKCPAKITILLCTLFLLSLTPPAVCLRSLLVMSVYSRRMDAESIPYEKNFTIHIPGGTSTKRTDWYPFVMTFADNEGFQNYMGNPSLSLTILYNFPAFSLKRGCSRLYDENSPYYSSFYGAYLVSDSTNAPYGFFSDGSINRRELEAVPEFDFYYLVLSDFGLEREDFVFDCDIRSVQPDTFYAGYEQWTRIDAKITTNGTCHTPVRNAISYLQYGSPAYKSSFEFSPLEMYGRIYARYFPEWNTSIFFYIIAADETALENCDNDILSRSSLTSLEI